MTRYDPDRVPDAATWLALEELDRIALIEAYHRRAGVRLPNGRLHATVHAMVENQLAAAVPAVVDTLSRLRGEGLDRHEAIHAIGLVLAEHLGALMRDAPREADPNAAYERALRELTAESWRAV
jgi:hypothetical protein